MRLRNLREKRVENWEKINKKGGERVVEGKTIRWESERNVERKSRKNKEVGERIQKIRKRKKIVVCVSKRERERKKRFRKCVLGMLWGTAAAVSKLKCDFCIK